MSEAACKAAICSYCEYAIIDPRARERAVVISNLSANQQLTEVQYQQIAELFDWFMGEVKKYEDVNEKLYLALQKIVPV